MQNHVLLCLGRHFAQESTSHWDETVIVRHGRNSSYHLPSPSSNEEISFSQMGVPRGTKVDLSTSSSTKFKTHAVVLHLRPKDLTP